MNQVTENHDYGVNLSIIKEIAMLLNVPARSDTSVRYDVTQKQVDELGQYLGFLRNSIIEKRIDPEDEWAMFENFLEYYNLYANFDLKTYIQKGDIVEAYSEDFVQIYRNRTFLKLCSYDLYTLLSHPFPMLFRRDEKITAQIVSRAIHCMTKGEGIEPVGVENNNLQEQFARNSRVFEIQHKWCSPLFSRRTDRPMALFCTMQARCIGESNVTGIGFTPPVTN